MNTNEFALNNINLKIEDGEFVLLVGDSGSGKSTLLRAINALVPHFYGGVLGGKVSVYGKDPFKEPPREMAKIVGTVLQDPENQIIMNEVEREIVFGLENRGMSEDEITKRLEEVLDLLNISHLRHRKVRELSGGEKQKVAIASAMANHPRVLLLDEPTSQIDPKSAEELLSIIQRINDELGITVLIVEHRMENTMHRADRLVVMEDGKIVGDGEPRVIASQVDLDKIGVGYPPVARVARRYGKEFLPLTVKEARKVLRDVFENVKIKGEEKGKKETIVKIKNVRFSYDSKEVIRGLSMDIPEKGVTGVIGRNGSGKTTLAKLVVGLVEPDYGRIEYRIKKEEIGMVFQNPNAHIIGESVRDDIAYTLKARGENVDERVENIMKILGISHLSDKNPLDLSGGEKLLFALATVLVFEPKILILDEPTRGLSWKNKVKLEEIIKEYGKKHSVILISHDMEMIARTADEVALISEGKIALMGPKRKILSSSLTFSPQLNKLVQGYDADKKILTEEDLK